MNIDDSVFDEIFDPQEMMDEIDNEGDSLQDILDRVLHENNAAQRRYLTEIHDAQVGNYQEQLNQLREYREAFGDTLESADQQLIDTFLTNREEDLRRYEIAFRRVTSDVQGNTQDLFETIANEIDRMRDTMSDLVQLGVALNIGNMADKAGEEVESSSELMWEVRSILNNTPEEMEGLSDETSRITRTLGEMYKGMVSATDLRKSVNKLVNEYSVRDNELITSIGESLARVERGTGLDDLEGLTSLSIRFEDGDRIVNELGDSIKGLSSQFAVSSEALAKSLDDRAAYIEQLSGGDSTKAIDISNSLISAVALAESNFLDSGKLLENLEEIRLGNYELMSQLSHGFEIKDLVTRGDIDDAMSLYIQDISKLTGQNLSPEIEKIYSEQMGLSIEDWNSIKALSVRGDNLTTLEEITQGLSESVGSIDKNLSEAQHKGFWDKAGDHLGTTYIGQKISQLVESTDIGFSDIAAIIYSLQAGYQGVRSVRNVMNTVRGSATQAGVSVPAYIGGNIRNTITNANAWLGSTAAFNPTLAGTASASSRLGTRAAAGTTYLGGALMVGGLVSGIVDATQTDNAYDASRAVLHNDMLDMGMGTVVGGAIGSLAGPLGTVVGGAVGGILGPYIEDASEGLENLMTDAFLTDKGDTFEKASSMLLKASKEFRDSLKEEASGFDKQQEEERRMWEEMQTNSQKMTYLMEKRVLTEDEASKMSSGDLDEVFSEYQKGNLDNKIKEIDAEQGFSNLLADHYGSSMIDYSDDKLGKGNSWESEDDKRAYLKDAIAYRLTPYMIDYSQATGKSKDEVIKQYMDASGMSGLETSDYIRDILSESYDERLKGREVYNNEYQKANSEFKERYQQATQEYKNNWEKYNSVEQAYKELFGVIPNTVVDSGGNVVLKGSDDYNINGIGQYESGLDRVPYDGLAYIHKDESILNKEAATAWRSGTYSLTSKDITASISDMTEKDWEPLAISLIKTLFKRLQGDEEVPQSGTSTSGVDYNSTTNDGATYDNSEVYGPNPLIIDERDTSNNTVDEVLQTVVKDEKQKTETPQGTKSYTEPPIDVSPYSLYGDKKGTEPTEWAKQFSDFIMGHESGGDESVVVANDKGGLSVGQIGWHESRAGDVIRAVYDADTKSADAILDKYGASGLKDKILSNQDSDWVGYIPNSNETQAIQEILAQEHSKAIQDDIRYTDTQWGFDFYKNKGITDPKALAFMVDYSNQNGYYKSNIDSIIKEAMANGGDLDAFYNAAVYYNGDKYGRRIDAYDSLKAMEVPQYADGNDYVSQDQIALIHRGEMVIPKDKNPLANSNNTSTPFNFEGTDLTEVIRTMKWGFDFLAQKLGNIKPMENTKVKVSPKEYIEPEVFSLGG